MSVCVNCVQLLRRLLLVSAATVGIEKLKFSSKRKNYLFIFVAKYVMRTFSTAAAGLLMNQEKGFKKTNKKKLKKTAARNIGKEVFWLQLKQF